MIYVVLPAYNEEDALAPLVEKIDCTMREMGAWYRLVVGNDGSTDNTARVARSLFEQYPMQIITHRYNRGLGEPIRDVDDVIETRAEVRWDGAAESVRAAVSDMLGALVIAERPLPSDDPRIPAVLLAAIRDRGVEHLPWPESATDLRARSEWLRSSDHAPTAWPDLGWPALAASADAWLLPFLPGITRKSQLSRVDLNAALRTLFTRQQLRALDELAPVHLQTPAGTHARLEYSAGNPPVLSVRLQEMFGQTETPTVAGGRVPVRIHLLSPAGRPLAVTQNLVTFWKEAGAGVQAQGGFSRGNGAGLRSLSVHGFLFIGHFNVPKNPRGRKGNAKLRFTARLSSALPCISPCA